MRNYDIYLIEKEVAFHYFGREQVLYHFFVEASRPVPSLVEIIDRQYKYITRSIPFHVFDYHMNKIDSMQKGFKMKKEKQQLTIYSTGSRAVVTNKGRKLSLISTGSFEAETLVFEHLRRIESSFLAVDLEGNSIGWLSPIKQAHYI
ncbi:sporulation inhibitor of replication protein SirA [Pseudalkalibacillus sp. R45]|uniref:sporulation inhibitor of replication protein SirA n=1 Tax=Pseudalkalibacillus sp. R45 TaxID=3457433 RepID=UPI003FCCE78F